MKKLVLMSALLSLLLACREKKVPASQVPDAVISAFNAKYPNASAVKWEKEDEESRVEYEAEFTFNGKKIEAAFDSTGSFIKEE